MEESVNIDFVLSIKGFDHPNAGVGLIGINYFLKGEDVSDFSDIDMLHFHN